MRRIITGHNKESKSVITMDGPPARSIGEDVGGLFEIWNTDGSDIISTDSIDRADEEIILSPPNGSVSVLSYASHSSGNSLGDLCL